MYVFIHGTLKQNEPNSYYISQPENGRSMIVGKGSTVKKYPLVVASRYNIPFLLDAAGKGHVSLKNIHAYFWKHILEFFWKLFFNEYFLFL